MSTTETSSSTSAREARVVCLTASAGAGLERALAHPAELGGELAGDDRRPVGVGEHVAAADVDVVVEPDRHRLRRDRGLERARRRSRSPATRVRRPDGSTTTSSPARQTPPATSPA